MKNISKIAVDRPHGNRRLCAHKSLVCLALILLSGSAWSFTNAITGYACCKSDLLVPDPSKGKFRQLQLDRHYELVKQIDTGYVILWENTDGTPRLALVPFHTKIGNPTAHPYEPPITLINIGGITAQPGFIPFKAGDSYPVLAQTNGIYSVVYTCQTLTQTVAVAETNFTFISLTDYAGIIRSLVSAARTRMATGASPDHVAATFTDYQGIFSAETASARRALRKQYFETAVRAQYQAENEAERQRVDAEQTAKGLVNYQGEWITKARAAEIQKEIAQFEADQAAKGLVKYHDEWITAEEKEKRLAEERRKQQEPLKQ